MAVAINSETKLTRDYYVLLPEDGKIHEIICESTGRKDRARYQALEDVTVELSRVW
jgi:hypothetical protein